MQTRVRDSKVSRIPVPKAGFTMVPKPKFAIALIFLPLALGGCLQPMYGGVAGDSLRSELAAIKVEPISDRIGHYLGNELVVALNGTGSEVTPKYRLLISIAEKVQTPLIDTISGRATAGTVVVDANYRLLPVGTSEPIVQGTAFVAANYDRTSQRFANVRAARDAEIRTAKALSEQIHVRIASALSDRK